MLIRENYELDRRGPDGRHSLLIGRHRRDLFVKFGGGKGDRG